MADKADEDAHSDPAARGFDGRPLLPAAPPTEGEPPSRAWLAQLGRAPTGEYLDGKQVVQRLTVDGLAVPGDDPLYQYLGVKRLFAETLKAQQEDLLTRMRETLREADEQHQRMVESAQATIRQMLAEASEAGTAAAAGRREESEAAFKRLAGYLDEEMMGAVLKLRAAMAEESEATAAAIGLKVAGAISQLNLKLGAKEGRGGPLGRLGAGWSMFTGQARTAASWAALLCGSVLAGLLLVWLIWRHGAAR